MIFVMGLTMLKMDRAKAKWRIKLVEAFSGKRTYELPPPTYFIREPSIYSLFY